jgi:hypothetical protein
MLSRLGRSLLITFWFALECICQDSPIPILEEHNVRSGFLEHEDFHALRGALPDYAQVAVSLAYYSGMRMGEVCSLEWRQINWTEGKLYLRAQETKTDTPRILYLTGDLLKILVAWKQRCEAKWPSCPWICHRRGIRLESLKHSWRKACQRVGLGTMVKDEETGELVWNGPIPHDFRRTSVRNMVRAGIPEKIAIAISGHKTRSVFDRYNIVNETDLARAAKSLSDYFDREEQASMGTLAGTLTEAAQSPTGDEDTELIGIAEGGMELAREIEPPTCGLQISDKGLLKSLKIWAILSFFQYHRRFRSVLDYQEENDMTIHHM